MWGIWSFPIMLWMDVESRVTAHHSRLLFNLTSSLPRKNAPSRTHRSANQNRNQVSPHTRKMATIKKQKITSVSKDMEKLEHLCTVGEIIFFNFLLQTIFYSFILLLLLSHFSRVQHCATQQTAAHQAPPSVGFSRQEDWSGVPSPSPSFILVKFIFGCAGSSLQRTGFLQQQEVEATLQLQCCGSSLQQLLLPSRRFRPGAQWLWPTGLVEIQS